MSEYEPTDWRPGDVAVVGWAMTSGEERAIYTGSRWQTESGINLHIWDPTTARRLVVIDPEDAEQVERLLELESAQYDVRLTKMQPEEVSIMQAALREFANPAPLKPPEPQGQGAVIEDAQGVRWVRVEPTNPDITAWVAAWTGTVDYPQPADYDDISAVRVLSEGVTP